MKITGNTKKKIIIISLCAAAALVIAAVIVTVSVLNNGYLKKLDYDHIDPVSYNGVRIVGEDGEFFLVKDGKKLSAGYTSLKSVNDYYGDIANYGTGSETDAVLFDYYIAKKADSGSYYLVTSGGEEYSIAGDNYSLSSVSLPYIIFVNNTTSRMAAVSLLKLESDLSRRTNNELALTSFSTVEAIKGKEEKALCTHLYATDEARYDKYSLFRDDGSLIVSSQHLEMATFKDGEKELMFCFDPEQNAMYSSKGELLGKGEAALSKVSDTYGYMLCPDLSGGPKQMKLFSAKANISLSDAEYDLSAAAFYSGCVVLPSRNGGTYAVSALTGERILCTQAEKVFDGVLRLTLDDGGFAYITERAELLIRTSHSDFVLRTELSAGDCFVFTSESYNSVNGDINGYHFTKALSNPSSMSFEANTAVSLLTANNGTVTVEGTYLLSQNDGGKSTYRICTPFAANPMSDSFDSIDAYCQAGIYWCRGTSYKRGSYDILDPISNHKAGSIACSEGEFARVAFEFLDYSVMIPDPHDRESGVPVLLFNISVYADDETATSSIRYYALYRSASISSDDFDKGVLRVSEIGMNLLRSEPYRFLPEDNCLILNGTSYSKAFRLNDSKIIVEAVSIHYHISDIIYDRSDDSELYYVVDSDNGKAGLFDKDGNMILAPYYDGVYSVEKNHFTVSLRGGMGVVEYKNGQLRKYVDYIYLDITPLADGGYLATNAYGDKFLYDGDKIVKDSNILGRDMLAEYSVGEDGALLVRYSEILFINGRLYIHEGENSYAPKRTSFKSVALEFGDIANPRAKLVCYCDASGKTVSETVIYPTESGVNEFALEESADNGGWYLSLDAEEQTEAVTRESVLALEEYVIMLYPKK